MKVFIVMCLIVICFSDTVYGMTISDFFNNMPGWDSISSTWNNIVLAIKKPVRIRRLGSIGKRKSTSNPNSGSTSPIFSISTTTTTGSTTKEILPTAGKILSLPKKKQSPPSSRRITFPEHGFPEPVTVSVIGRVKLPYIKEPLWKTLEDWRLMQKPHFVKIVKGENDKDFEVLVPGTENQLSNIPDDDEFGVLIFV